MNKTQTEEKVNETAMMAQAIAANMLDRMIGDDKSVIRFCALANDLNALANDECEGDANQAQRVLISRIGGLKNLKSYTECLIVGIHERDYSAIKQWADSLKK